jgi:hypothetical protein
MMDGRFNESAWALRTSGTQMTTDEVCRTANAEFGRSWTASEISRALDELVRNALASIDSAGRYQWIPTVSR